jgi:branched-chain amino acid transport system substrate-binding protein
MIRWRSLALAAAAAVLMPALGWAQARPIRIGTIFPLSGSLALLGETQMNGGLIAVDMVNERGGIKGRPVQVVKADAPNPGAAISEANRLIGSEGVKLIVGSYASSIASAYVGVAERAGIIHFEIGGVADSITQRGFKNIFRTPPTGSSLGFAALDYARLALAPALGIPPDKLKVALVYEDSEFGASVAKGLSAKAQELGIPLQPVPYAKDTSDLTPVVLRIREAGSDVLLSVQYVNDAILFWKQARQFGLNVKAHVGMGAGHFEKSFPEAVGRDASGVFIAGPPIDLNPAGLGETARKHAEEFYARYERKHAKKPSSIAMMGFTGMMILLEEVLSGAGNPDDPASIREAALRVDRPIGATASGWGVKFNPPGPNGGQNERAFWVIRQWQDGELFTVYPKQFAVRSPIHVPLPAWDRR